MFQSTLPRGERPPYAFFFPPTSGFNPRSHAGSDSTRGTRATAARSFNPRSHAGSDLAKDKDVAAAMTFQSTLPRGERPWSSSSSRGGTMFQSTLPRGERRFYSFHGIYYCRVSIHAPTRGATLLPLPFQCKLLCFNPRSHAGSDANSRKLFSNGTKFQSTLPRGERLHH